MSGIIPPSEYIYYTAVDDIDTYSEHDVMQESVQAAHSALLLCPELKLPIGTMLGYCGTREKHEVFQNGVYTPTYWVRPTWKPRSCMHNVISTEDIVAGRWVIVSFPEGKEDFTQWERWPCDASTY